MADTDNTNNSEDMYAVFMETNGKEIESWYNFIKVKGNEEALQHLQDQLESVDTWYVIDDMSTFDLDLEHPVNAKTAKSVTKLELNAYMFHRKFDGKLQKIDLEFSKRDSDETKISKTFDRLGYGQIDQYVDGEDINPEQMYSGSEYSSYSDGELEKKLTDLPTSLI